METFESYLKNPTYLKVIMSASHENEAAESRIKDEEKTHPVVDEYFQKQIFKEFDKESNGLLSHNELEMVVERFLIQSEKFNKERWKHYIYHLINDVAKDLYTKLRVKYEKSDGVDEEWRKWLSNECHESVSITFESTMILAVVKANRKSFKKLYERKQEISDEIFQKLSKRKEDGVTLDEFLKGFISEFHELEKNTEEEIKEFIHLSCTNRMRFWGKAEHTVERHIFEDHFARDCTTENCQIL